MGRAPRPAAGVATRAAAGEVREVAEAAGGGVPSEVEADSGMDVEVDPSLVLDAVGFDVVVDPNVSPGAHDDALAEVQVF